MNYTRRIFLVGLLSASIALMLAYILESVWLGAAAVLGLGVLGWFGQRQQRWHWTIHIFFAGVVLLVIIGVLQSLRLYLLLPAILGALAAWDLARFQERIADTRVTDGIRKIEKRHLILLGLALGSGAIFAIVVLTTQIQISFSIILVLGVILIISFGQVFRMVSE
jgi:hypothetical protein